MRLIKDYRIIDVPLNVGCATHSFYIKQHSDKSGKNESKTLFVGNIDYGGILSHEKIDSILRELFSGFGDIESISISAYNEDEDLFHNTRFAHVIFKKKSSVNSAIKSSDDIYNLLTKEIGYKYGLAEQCKIKSGKEIAQKYSMYDSDINLLREVADEYMREYDEKEQILLAERKKRAREEDSDGFVLVKNRKKQKRVIQKRGSGDQRQRKTKKKYELKNFYRFQMREEKREQLADLRKKFEEDKVKFSLVCDFVRTLITPTTITQYFGTVKIDSKNKEIFFEIPTATKHSLQLKIQQLPQKGPSKHPFYISLKHSQRLRPKSRMPCTTLVSYFTIYCTHWLNSSTLSHHSRSLSQLVPTQTYLSPHSNISVPPNCPAPPPMCAVCDRNQQLRRNIPHKRHPRSTSPLYQSTLSQASSQPYSPQK
eukprot:gene12121-25432_t